MSAHPAPAKWPRRFLVALSVAALLALAALLFAWNRAASETALAAGPEPGMSLAAPATVFEGVPFTLTINADPAPDVEICCFGSEVVFPAGLKWLPRASCLDEVQVERQDGGPLAFCASFIAALGGTAQAVVSESGAPPLEALNVTPNSTTPLVELDFVCNAPGSHTLTLTAAPEAPNGAQYFNISAQEILVKTIGQVADTIVVNCVSGPVPSPTPTALPPTPAPTALPLTPAPPPCPLTPSGSPLPGMSLEAPATVFVGATFTLCVNADPSPPELIAAFTAEVLFGAAPELDECDNTFDDDGDAIVNDGCPQVGGAPEAGRFCDNTTDDEDNDLAAPGIQIDGFINDGCPQVGATAESDQCAGNIDDDGDGFVNDGCPAEGAPETGVQCAAGNDTDDDGFLNLGDGFVNDGCPAVGDPEFDECANAINDDPGDDPFVNDGCPVVQVTEAGACDGRIDDDNDGAPNDGCSQVGVTGEAGSFCDDTVDDDSDGFVNDGCRSAGTPEVGPACANATDDDGDGRPNDGCLMKGADLTWLQRPSCEDEVQVTLKDGGGLAICDSLDTFVLGGAGIGVLGDSGLPPFANLNVTPSSTTLLVELDFVCNTPGSHTLTLTAEPDSPPGALYAGTAANALFLKTVLAQIDLNFDGVPEPHQVADTLVINCVAPVGGLVVDLAPQQDGLPAATGDSRAGNARLLAAVAAGVTAAALALTGAAWYARRRRRAL